MTSVTRPCFWEFAARHASELNHRRREEGMGRSEIGVEYIGSSTGAGDRSG